MAIIFMMNGSRIKVKFFMMTKNRQGVHPQDFLHYPQVVMKGSLPIYSMKAIEEILILIKN